MYNGRSQKPNKIRVGFEKILNQNYKKIILVIVLIYLSLSIYSAYNDTLCGDEQLYMNVTYNYFHTFDTIVLRDTPYLLHIINVAPVMILDKEGYYPNKEIIQAMYDTGYDIRTILFIARIPSIILGLVLLLFIYLFANELFNKKISILAMFLFVIDGNLSGHFHLISTDITIATFMFVTIYYFWRYIKYATKKDFLLFLLFGLLSFISKISGIYLIVILCCFAPLMIFSKEINIPQPGKFKTKNTLKESHQNHAKNKILKTKRYSIIIISSMIIFSIALSLVYYGFHPMKDLVPKGMEDRAEYKLNILTQNYPSLNNTIRYIYEYVPFPMPAYIKTFGQQFANNYHKQDIYLNGKFSETGFRQYFLELFFVKMPTIVIVLTIAFILLFIICYKQIKNKANYWILIIPIIIQLLIISMNHAQYGFKYIYPTLPFLYILLASIILLIPKKYYNVSTIILISLLVFSSFEFVTNSNNIMAYQNFISKSKSLDKYTIDGSLDWGQNGDRIIREINNIERNNNTKIYVDFRYYHIINIYKSHLAQNVTIILLTDDPKISQENEGYIFITKNVLYCYELKRPCYNWLKNNSSNIEKVKTISQSIDMHRFG